MNTKTPKSLVLIFLGLGVVLLIIIAPIWFSNDPEDPIITTGVDYQTANTPPIVDIKEEQKANVNLVKHADPVIQNNSLAEVVHEQPKKNSNDSKTENRERSIDIKAQQVKNIEHLTKNTQTKAESFLSKSRHNTSDLSLEEKTSIADTVSVFSARTVNRIERFLRGRH